tara:strand:- start:20 stop:598 length:579 start_codon:yes stop_codon:yes gene_type:complete
MSNKNCVGNCVKKNEMLIHPFNLNNIINKNEKMCPTMPYYDKKSKELKNFSDNCSKIDDTNIINYMNMPYIHLDNSYLLENVFNIREIDDLEKWVKENLKKPINYIGRVINIWIKENLIELKKYQDLLVEILFIIISEKENYQKTLSKKLIKEFKDKVLPNFIKSWLTKMNPEDFYFDLLNDLEKYLSNKYK